MHLCHRNGAHIVYLQYVWVLHPFSNKCSIMVSFKAERWKKFKMMYSFTKLLFFKYWHVLIFKLTKNKWYFFLKPKLILKWNSYNQTTVEKKKQQNGHQIETVLGWDPVTLKYNVRRFLSVTSGQDCKSGLNCRGTLLHVFFTQGKCLSNSASVY